MRLAGTIEKEGRDGFIDPLRRGRESAFLNQLPDDLSGEMPRHQPFMQAAGNLESAIAQEQPLADAATTWWPYLRIKVR
jgi:hypothetical protein